MCIGGDDKKPCSLHGALKKPKHPNFGYYTIPDQPITKDNTKKGDKRRHDVAMHICDCD